MPFRRVALFLLLLAALTGRAGAADPGRPPATYDVVVYGGTAGGVMAAVAAAREGATVALLEPGRHVGGMATGGLSGTDTGKREVIGGLALEFYVRLGRHYQVNRFQQHAAWNHEPKVGEAVLREMLRGAGVAVFHDHRLCEMAGAAKEDARVVSVAADNGAVFHARVFIDATYEGDLMAQAGVTYAVGREAAAEYGETLAGVKTHASKPVRIGAYDEAGRLLPGVNPAPPGPPGSGDRKVQAYNFRVIATNNPANRRPFPRPPRYDPRRYDLHARFYEASERAGVRQTFVRVVTPNLIPNDKADINNRGQFSTDYVGGSWEYPEADYARREEIRRDHVEYVQGFFYFLANDPRLPSHLRDDARRWGLASDEFADTDNWPHQLYVREARRMVGQYVMTQRDVQTDVTKPDAVAMGSYASDAHFFDRFASADGRIDADGGIFVPTVPYHIPYRSLVPKREQATNLLVCVCVSASHVAYCSLRMEPQYMMLGHAAGVAAAAAARKRLAVQDVDPAALTARLRDQGGIFAYDGSEQNQVIYNITRGRLPGFPGPGLPVRGK